METIKTVRLLIQIIIVKVIFKRLSFKALKREREREREGGQGKNKTKQNNYKNVSPTLCIFIHRRIVKCVDMGRGHPAHLPKLSSHKRFRVRYRLLEFLKMAFELSFALQCS